MGRRDDLIAQTLTTLRDRCELDVEAGFVGKIVDGCGPGVYGAGQGDIDPSDARDLARLRRNFLSGRLEFPDSPELDDTIAMALETFDPGTGERISLPVIHAILAIQTGRRGHFS